MVIISGVQIFRIFMVLVVAYLKLQSLPCHSPTVLKFLAKFFILGFKQYIVVYTVKMFDIIQSDITEYM